MAILLGIYAGFCGLAKDDVFARRMLASVLALCFAAMVLQFTMIGLAESMRDEFHSEFSSDFKNKERVENAPGFFLNVFTGCFTAIMFPLFLVYYWKGGRDIIGINILFIIVPKEEGPPIETAASQGEESSVTTPLTKGNAQLGEMAQSMEVLQDRYMDSDQFFDDLEQPKEKKSVDPLVKLADSDFL
jgi:hypothetical protein